MNKVSKIKMSLAILLTLFAVFTIGNGIALKYSEKKFFVVADQIATRDLDNLLEHTDKLLAEAEVSALNLRALATTNPDVLSSDIYAVMDRFMVDNPHLYGVVISFDPDVVRKRGIAVPVTFCQGSKREGFRHYGMEASSLAQYNHTEWYEGAKKSGKGYWAHPLRAANGILLAPYSMPFYDKDGSFMGVICCDISLEQLNGYISKAAPYPDAVVTLMDQSFKFVSHPNPDYVLKMTFDRLMAESNVQMDKRIFTEMKVARRGSSSYEGGGGTHLIYYAPVRKADWTLTIDFPAQNVYAHVDEVKMCMLLNMFFGMIIFGFVCWRLMKVIDRYEKAAAQKAMMQGELNIAATIQKGMLPKLYPAFPDVKELDVYGMLVPAKEVGGDLFDYFIRDGKFFFCIGDVSGKGVPASLFMAVLRSLFRNVSLHEDNPSQIATALNTALSEGNDQNMFCTMMLGVLDISTGYLRFCNCGHNAPVVRRIKGDGTCKVSFEKVETNIAVGIFEGFPYRAQETVMKPGEALFLYTDGITEAENTTKELYGDDRLLEALAAARNDSMQTAKDYVEYVYRNVKSFSGAASQSDDITMVMIEYKGK